MKKAVITSLCCAIAAGTFAQGKILVAYYSWSPEKNTKYAAEIIAKELGATLHEIVPEKAYPEDFQECLKVAGPECKEKSTPALASTIDLAQYDLVVVGSPNWYGTMTPPVRTFLAADGIKGKKVAAFLTHGTGGMQRYETEVREVCKDRASEVLAVAAWTGATIKQAEADIKAWAKKLAK